MKIEKIDENQVKITLSCTEMLQMNAENSSNDSSLLTELLGALEQEFQFSIIRHAIHLEMIPSKKDGCEIFLTKTESQQQPNYVENLMITSFFESEDALYAARLSKRNLNGQIAVYLLNDEFYLVITSNEKESLSKLQLLLSDLGDSVQYPAFMEGVLKEYGTLIFEENTPPLLTE
ncbi:MAG: adaptor protein MecA [Clostridia bacterium]|nr:adaptor protein MecA [Clostridia bacterium]